MGSLSEVLTSLKSIEEDYIILYDIEMFLKTNDLKYVSFVIDRLKKNDCYHSFINKLEDLKKTEFEKSYK